MNLFVKFYFDDTTIEMMKTALTEMYPLAVDVIDEITKDGHVFTVDGDRGLNAIGIPMEALVPLVASVMTTVKELFKSKPQTDDEDQESYYVFNITQGKYLCMDSSAGSHSTLPISWKIFKDTALIYSYKTGVEFIRSLAGCSSDDCILELATA